MYAESNAWNERKLSMLKIIDILISFYSNSPNLLLRKPKFSFRYLKLEFYKKYVMVSVDKTPRNVAIEWRLHYVSI